MIRFNYESINQYVNVREQVMMTKATCTLTVMSPETSGLITEEHVTSIGPIRLPLTSGCHKVEVELLHPTGYGLSKRLSKSITAEILDDSTFSVELLPCNFVASVLSNIAKFTFWLHISESMTRQELIDTQWLIVNEREGDSAGSRRISLVNDAATIHGAVELKNIELCLGDLRRQIIDDPEVRYLDSRDWYIAIDRLDDQFRPKDYVVLIQSALAQEKTLIPERVPLHLERQFPKVTGRPLDVRVIIPSLESGKQTEIRYHERRPELYLAHLSGNAAIDETVRNVHNKLQALGIPFDPVLVDRYQKLLQQLLLYRYAILNVPGYTSTGEITTDERAFHSHLHGQLATSLDFDLPIYIEVPAGNSRIDLLISELPVELKLEHRVHVDTAAILKRYESQAADYVARCESKLGFLLVLDGVLHRPHPTPPVEQDVMVLEVATASGGTVPVIGIIIRLPQSPSTFSKSTNRRGPNSRRRNRNRS